MKGQRRVVWGWILLAVCAGAVALARYHYSSLSPAALIGLPTDTVTRQADQLLRSLPPPTTARPTPPPGLPPDQVRAMITALPPPVMVSSGPNLQLWMRPFQPKVASTPGPEFSRVDGSSSGFVRAPLPRPYLWMEPGTMNQGPMASGDVNLDGWPDVAVGTTSGVQLYINTGGTFVQQTIDYPAMNAWVITEVMLVDLDGDGQLDLVFCAWKHDCHILWNRRGTFSEKQQTVLPYAGENTVNALAVGDFSRTGRLDLVTGAAVWEPRFFYPAPAVTRIWHNDGKGGFSPSPLEGPRGETTSLLVVDLNGDGWPDLWVGHDYDEPDVIYLNDHGALKAVSSAASPIPVTVDQAMSIDSGDIRNDGTVAIYESSIADSPEAVKSSALDAIRVRNASASCDVYRQVEQIAACASVAEFQKAVLDGYDRGTLDSCKKLVRTEEERDCVISAIQWDRVLAALPRQGARKPVEMEACGQIPADFSELLDICSAMRLSPYDNEDSYRLPGQLPQLPGSNLLYVNGGGTYRDATAAWGAGYGGWSWNAKFADLDNDGWQDLFIAQGTRQRRKNPSNLFYRNLSGGGFRESSSGSGLEDHNPTGASLFLDVNESGALDLITKPFLLTPVEWHNDHPLGPGFEVRLDDRTTANRWGVGARVEIRSPDGRLQVREIKGSGGYESHDELVAHFGLGDWPSVASITVRWAGGQVQALPGQSLAPGRYTLVRV
ncbi:MAG: CRTAC1 family protein [Candidatus Dormibacteria bacterium]